MISRSQVDTLLEFQNGDYLVTSCYLNLDRAKQAPQMLKIRVKDLLQSAQQQLADRLGSHDQTESLRSDFGFIEDFAMQEIFASRHKALAIFSCAAHKFWQTYGLPPIPRNILVADPAPYVRPLLAILSQHRRYCVVLADHTNGQLFEVHMGEIVERTDIIDTVPRRVKDGGLGGREERKIERHHDQAVQQHFQRLGDATFKLFKRDKFDFLVLGGQKEVLDEFRQELHPYLKERWISDFPAKPFATPPAEVLTRVLELANQFERDQEKRLAEELVHKVSAGNRAVSGVTATLAALQRGEAQTLLVEEGFETPGYVCTHCHYGSITEENCPQCRQPLSPYPDIIEKAIELALEKNCQIEYLRDPAPLRDLGRVGALLRYQA